MKPIAETVESMFTSRSMQEDEYLNEDDVLFGKLNAAFSVRLKRVFQST